MNSSRDSTLADSAAALHRKIEEARLRLREDTRTLGEGADVLTKGGRRFADHFTSAVAEQKSRLMALTREQNAHVRKRDVLQSHLRFFHARLGFTILVLRLRLFWYRNRTILTVAIVVAIVAGIVVFLGPQLVAAWASFSAWLKSLTPAVPPPTPPSPPSPSGTSP